MSYNAETRGKHVRETKHVKRVTRDKHVKLRFSIFGFEHLDQNVNLQIQNDRLIEAHLLN